MKKSNIYGNWIKYILVSFRRKRGDLCEKVTFGQTAGLARKEDRIQNANKLVDWFNIFIMKYFIVVLENDFVHNLWQWMHLNGINN